MNQIQIYLLGLCIIDWSHKCLRNVSLSWNTLTDYVLKYLVPLCRHSSRFSAIPYIYNFYSFDTNTERWHVLWLRMPSVFCLLHNKVTKAEEMAIGRNEAGQQMSFGHLSPGPWLSEGMRCVCTHQSQGHLPEREWKKASTFYFLLLKERCSVIKRTVWFEMV